jgi:hypothetical protein
MLKEPANLKENDELRFGSTKMVFTLLDENKVLQIEGRRPEELGYDGAASKMPQFVPTGEPADVPDPEPATAAAPAAATPFHAEPEPEEDEGPRRMADYGMGAGDEPIGEDDFNFEDLPEPVLPRRASRPEMPSNPARPEHAAPPSRPAQPAIPAAAGGSDQTAFIPTGMVSSPPPMMPIAADRAADGNEPTAAFNFNAGIGIPGMTPPSTVPPASTPMRAGVSWEDFAPNPTLAGNGSGPGSTETPAPAAAAPRRATAPAPAASATPAAMPPAQPSHSAAPSPAAAHSAAPVQRHVAAPETAMAEESENPQHMIEVWEKALLNKSPIVRRQAAKMLKKLTGKDYEIPQ